MTLQQHTTYEQSIRLKGIGFPQVVHADQHGENTTNTVHYWGFIDKKAMEEQHVIAALDGVGPFLMRYVPGNADLDGMVIMARALSRQEIEDILLERYVIRISQSSNNQCEDDSIRTEVWLQEPNAAGRSFVAGRSGGRDPFPALYEALVWMLEQERAGKAT